MVLEVRQTKTQTLDLQPAASSTLLERAVRTAAADKHAMDQTIEDLVDNNARRLDVSSHHWQSERYTKAERWCSWKEYCAMKSLASSCKILQQQPKQPSASLIKLATRKCIPNPVRLYSVG
jgi:hypothetical protein